MFICVSRPASFIVLTTWGAKVPFSDASQCSRVLSKVMKFLIQHHPRTMKFEKRHKNKYHVIIRFIKLLHHWTTRALAYLWFFVKGRMVCVVRCEGSLLHMLMVKQVIIFEASDLEMKEINQG